MNDEEIKRLEDGFFRTDVRIAEAALANYIKGYKDSHNNNEEFTDPTEDPVLKILQDDAEKAKKAYIEWRLKNLLINK